jgi:hypothetical protein
VIYLLTLPRTNRKTDTQVLELTVVFDLWVAERRMGEEMEARHPGTNPRDERVSSGDSTSVRAFSNRH